MAILAVQAIRKMRGGSQAHLMLGADGNPWVVKFQNNPQNLRVLANEFIVSSLASVAGLTVPEFGVIELDPWLASHSTNLEMDFGRGRLERCRPGLHFGSRFISKAIDVLTPDRLREVNNLAEFSGILALDKWTNNCDWRQVVFSKKSTRSKYDVAFIDHGYCFGEAEWKFEDAPLRGIYRLNAVYGPVTGWSSFSPWLERFEEMSPETIWKIVEAVPPEWFGADKDAADTLVDRLIRRRSRIRELILAFRNSDRTPFPNWTATQSSPRRYAKKHS
ncbi:HipA domain-containing protein [Granulicella aggregans]|uniref:HipA domain-containing protein n=1 Tax=Granulicella aggregans TaxID=474949 RepID=UPI0021E0B541|nr:HipA domain-containing protein [Granulicella aggregans]